MIGSLLWLVVMVVIVVALFQGTAWYRTRRLEPQVRHDGVPPGFVQTSEINIDPTTGIRQRVWYNPTTGDRFYENLPD